MANKFYQPGQDRAAKVNDLFATIAPRYDFINDLQSFRLHRAWKRRLVRMAGVGAGQRALDLCCGTGDVAFALAATGAEVVGLDFSEPCWLWPAGARPVTRPPHAPSPFSRAIRCSHLSRNSNSMP